MSYSSPGSGFRIWHVVVFLGVVIIAVEIVSIQTLGSKTEQFVFVTSAPPAQVPEQTVEVPVAAKDLPVGTVLTAGAGQWVTNRVRKDLLPPGAVTRDAELSGRRLARAVRTNEVFLATDLSHLPEAPTPRPVNDR